jgi:hypothetical protein
MTRSYNRSSSRAPPLLPPRESRQRQAGGTWNPKYFPSPAPSPINSPKSPSKSTGAQAADRAAIVRRKRDNRGGHGTLPRLPHGLRERGSGVNQIPIAQRVTFGGEKTGQGVSDSCGTVPVSVAKPLPPKSTIYRKVQPKIQAINVSNDSDKENMDPNPIKPNIRAQAKSKPKASPKPKPKLTGDALIKAGFTNPRLRAVFGGKKFVEKKSRVCDMQLKMGLKRVLK